MLQIPQSIREAMVQRAREAYPRECCGLLAGRDGRVTHHFPMTNIEASPTRYQMDPREQFQVFKTMRALGIELLAIYHSHPDHPAYPSQTDVSLAYYPEAVYIILGIRGDSTDVVIRGFYIRNQAISEADLAFTSE